MNNAEKYVYNVYKESSFSEAAKKLFVSQPALSATIKKHEAKLGYKIFNRQTSPITLTEKGNIYIEYLQELATLEEHLKVRLKEIHKPSSKTLAIGGWKSAAFHIIPKLCMGLYERHPNINITIDVGEKTNSDSLFDKLDKGKLDIVISTNYTADEFNSVVIMEEKYMIAVRKDYKDAQKLCKYSLTYNEVLTGKYPPEKEIADWDLFKNIHFFKPGDNSKSWKLFSDFYEKMPHTACRVSNFHNIDMQYKLMLEGLGAVFIPQSTILDKGYDSKNLYYFVLAIPNNIRQVTLLYKKNTYKEAYIDDIISIVREIYPLEENKRKLNK